MSTRKQVSEKSLELNVCAELIQCIRARPGCESAVWFGMTQSQERRTRLDETVINAPGHSLMLEFKSPKATSIADDLYKFSINRRQHNALELLVKGNPKAAYYVFPLYSKWTKLLNHSPNLIKDTWLVPVSCITLPSWTSQQTFQIELRRVGSKITLSGPRLLMNWEPINAWDYCADGVDQSLNPRLVGLPTELLRFWVEQLEDSRLRFTGLNAVYLPNANISSAGT